MLQSCNASVLEASAPMRALFTYEIWLFSCCTSCLPLDVLLVESLGWRHGPCDGAPIRPFLRFVLADAAQEDKGVTTCTSEFVPHVRAQVPSYPPYRASVLDTSALHTCVPVSCLS